MAKIELTDIPLFGIYFRTIDIQVDRQSSERGASAYRKAVRILENGINLVIYPEGGILPDPLLVKPFKDGAFQLAIRHKVAILPVGLPDNYKIMPDMAKIAKPGKIRIILHEPLQTANMKMRDMDSLKRGTEKHHPKRYIIMNIDMNTVERVTTLAKLSFNPEEKIKIQEDLNKIVSFFDKLNEVDTEGIEPLIFLTDEINAFREDEPFLEITKDEALKNAPQKNSDYFKVPKFLERE